MDIVDVIGSPEFRLDDSEVPWFNWPMDWPKPPIDTPPWDNCPNAKTIDLFIENCWKYDLKYLKKNKKKIM